MLPRSSLRRADADVASTASTVQAEALAAIRKASLPSVFAIVDAARAYAFVRWPESKILGRKGLQAPQLLPRCFPGAANRETLVEWIARRFDEYTFRINRRSQDRADCCFPTDAAGG